MKVGMQFWKWMIGLILGLLIKWICSDAQWVETYYSNGIYPPVGRLLRYIFGWIPFSAGDIGYLTLIILLIRWLVRWIRIIVLRRFFKYWGWVMLRQAAGTALLLYILFYTLWGINYSRIGVRAEMGLVLKDYETSELVEVMDIILLKLNAEAERVHLADRDSLKNMGFLRKTSALAYTEMAKTYPQLEFKTGSLKASLFGFVGNYAGFSGYLNPFTNEAQLNRSIPYFSQPFVACHEIAHQAGFSSESEANFVGYLAGKASPSPLYRYATYYDLFFYGLREVRLRDSTVAAIYIENVHSQVKEDRSAYLHFLQKYKSVWEPMVDSFYDAYLRANEQASGIRSYNEVIGLLVAYYHKYGAAAL